YIFEVLYPANRIVVDYGNTNELRLLAVINNETGIDNWDEFNKYPFVKANEYPQYKSLSDLKDIPYNNDEGLVLVFPNGFRLKYKHEEYKRLHRLLTGVNEKY